MACPVPRVSRRVLHIGPITSYSVLQYGTLALARSNSPDGRPEIFSAQDNPSIPMAMAMASNKYDADPWRPQHVMTPENRLAKRLVEQRPASCILHPILHPAFSPASSVELALHPHRNFPKRCLDATPPLSSSRPPTHEPSNRWSSAGNQPTRPPCLDPCPSPNTNPTLASCQNKSPSAQCYCGAACVTAHPLCRHMPPSPSHNVSQLNILDAWTNPRREMRHAVATPACSLHYLRGGPCDPSGLALPSLTMASRSRSLAIADCVMFNVLFCCPPPSLPLCSPVTTR